MKPAEGKEKGWDITDIYDALRDVAIKRKETQRRNKGIRYMKGGVS